MCCHMVDGYQRRLAWLLMEVHRPPKVRKIVSPDLMALLTDFGPLYFEENSSYWEREYFLLS